MMRQRRVYVGSDLECLFADYLTYIEGRATEFGITLDEQSPLLVNVVRPPLLAALRETTVRDKGSALRRQGAGTGDWTPHWFRYAHVPRASAGHSRAISSTTITPPTTPSSSPPNAFGAMVRKLWFPSSCLSCGWLVGGLVLEYGEQDIASASSEADEGCVVFLSSVRLRS